MYHDVILFKLPRFYLNWGLALDHVMTLLTNCHQVCNRQIKRTCIRNNAHPIPTTDIGMVMEEQHNSWYNNTCHRKLLFMFDFFLLWVFLVLLSFLFLLYTCKIYCCQMRVEVMYSVLVDVVKCPNSLFLFLKLFFCSITVVFVCFLVLILLCPYVAVVNMHDLFLKAFLLYIYIVISWSNRIDLM